MHAGRRHRARVRGQGLPRAGRGLAERHSRRSRHGRGEAPGRDGLRLHPAQLCGARVPARLPRGPGSRRAGEPHAAVRELVDGQIDHVDSVRASDAAGSGRSRRPRRLACHRGRPPPRRGHDAQPAHHDLGLALERVPGLQHLHHARPHPGRPHAGGGAPARDVLRVCPERRVAAGRGHRPRRRAGTPGRSPRRS